MERDGRPLRTEMPAHLLRVFERYEPDLKRILAGIHDDIMAIDDGRPRAELVNDALSMQSQCAAIAASLFIANLAAAKGAPIGLLASVGFHDMWTRTTMLLAGMDAMAAAPGATKQ